MRTAPIIVSLAALSLVATPAFAHRDRGPAVQDDSNHLWLDYKTDLSEAKRELRNDLRGAWKPKDIDKAHDEYRQEVADARHDYIKHMRKRGYRVGTVTVEPDPS